MPAELLIIVIVISSIIALVTILIAIGERDKNLGFFGFVSLCIAIGSSTWLYMSGTEPITYQQPINAVVVTAATEDKQIISTAVYDLDGQFHMLPLRGFLPAGMKVTVEKPNRFYYGIYYEKLSERVLIVEENKDSL